MQTSLLGEMTYSLSNNHENQNRPHYQKQLLTVIFCSGCFPKNTGSVWPAVNSFSRCWRWSRAVAHLQREPVASQQPVWRAAITTENARLGKNVAPMAVAIPASLPKTSTRVRNFTWISSGPLAALHICSWESFRFTKNTCWGFVNQTVLKMLGEAKWWKSTVADKNPINVRECFQSNNKKIKSKN